MIAKTAFKIWKNTNVLATKGSIALTEKFLIPHMDKDRKEMLETAVVAIREMNEAFIKDIHSFKDWKENHKEFSRKLVSHFDKYNKITLG